MTHEELCEATARKYVQTFALWEVKGCGLFGGGKMKKICKYAEDNNGDCYECRAYYERICECEFQYKDLNPDGSVNICECKKHKKEKEFIK